MGTSSKEEFKVFLGPGVMSKPKALAENIEKLLMEANRLGREGKTLVSVKTKAEWGQGTFAVMSYEDLKKSGIIKA